MLQKILDLPKLLLGTFAVLATMVFLYFNDPPKTLCDVQMEAVNKSLSVGFFSKKGPIKFQQGVMDAFNFCMEANSPGGCYDIFERLRFFEKQVRTIPSSCGGHKSVEKMLKALEKGIKLIVQIGWGEAPPETLFEKRAWMTNADLGLFCRMKREHIRLFGKKRWMAFREHVMAGLPEAQTMSRKQRWEKSLFSFPCKGYL